MIVSSLSRKVLLASLLFSLVSLPFMNGNWAMEPPNTDKDKVSIKRTSKSRGKAYDAFDAFDEGDDMKAGELLVQLRKDGAICPKLISNT